MRVLIINGSPRIKGATSTMMHMIGRDLKSSGIDVDFYDLSEIDMSHCIGCCSCYKTGHCCIDDDAEKLSELISEADGVVLGTPTYASNVSGLMKDLIDRGHFVIEQLLHNKYCITVATGENYGNKQALKVLNDLVLYSGGRLSGKIRAGLPFNDIQSIDGGLERRVHKVAQSLVRDMEHGHIYPFQRLFHFIIFFAGIKPFVRKKGALYQGVTIKWKKYGIT